MRTKEQFKAYVYEKVNEKRVWQKHSRIVFARGLAAFSLLFIISGVLVYGNFVNKNDYEVETYTAYSNEKGKAFYYYSKSVLADGVDDEKAENCLDAKIVAEMQEAVHENLTIENSGVITADIPQGFSFENDIADYNREIEVAVSGAGSIDQNKALEIAEEKCTIEYNVTDVFYDSETYIWKIVFYTKNTVGNCQTVYLNQDGSVRLIVYGE